MPFRRSQGMRNMLHSGRCRLAGQAMTESILLLPLYLLCVFFLLQAVQLGVAAVITNYSASSVARKAEREGKLTQVGQDYRQAVNNLMVAGMSLVDMSGNVIQVKPAADLAVYVRVRVNAFPLVGDFLNLALKDNFQEGPLPSTGLPVATTFGPYNFSKDNKQYYFLVNGFAKVRLNYNP